MCMRTCSHTNTNTRSQNTASTQMHGHGGPRASSVNCLTLWTQEEDEARSPPRLSPPELFYSYHRTGRHQLFTSVKERRQSNRVRDTVGNRRWVREGERKENRERRRKKLSQTDMDWDVEVEPGRRRKNPRCNGRTEAGKQSCSDNKGVYRPISFSSMSFYLPASVSCVDTLEPCCLTVVVSWMLWEH